MDTNEVKVLPEGIDTSEVKVLPEGVGQPLDSDFESSGSSTSAFDNDDEDDDCVEELREHSDHGDSQENRCAGRQVLPIRININM